MDNGDRIPAEVFPPGELLREEIDIRGWSQAEFAEIVGTTPATISEIVNARRGITPPMAKSIGAALGTSAIFWLNAEAAYQLGRTADPPKRISLEARIRERYPVRKMIRRKWIEKSSNPQVLRDRVCKFFEIDDLDDQPRLEMAARKSTPRGEDDDEFSMIQMAWVYRVKHLAAKLVVAKYSRAKLESRLDELRDLLSAPEETRHVARILGECGVRLIVVEPFARSKIDGACFWLNDESPVIGLTLRFDRIDNFWFVLRHEIQHVLRGDAITIDTDLGSTTTVPSIDDAELEANREAAEFCVPQAELEGFIQRVHPMYSQKRVIGFARRLGVHPGIAIGQIQNRIQRYDLLRKYQVGIREHVVPSTVTDGYGRELAI